MGPVFLCLISQSFTIHGLWPQDESYDNFEKFKIYYLPSNLKKDLYNYWPPKNTHWQSKYFLWSHEYNKHGDDYAQVIIDRQNGDFLRFY